jgi:AcrB/AcrD/AcrF family
MSGHDAAIAAMNALFGPIIGITLVLMAVFLPAAFLPGLTGQIYGQFALVIADRAASFQPGVIFDVCVLETDAVWDMMGRPENIQGDKHGPSHQRDRTRLHGRDHARDDPFP